MIIYPAIDIKNGRCVRLMQGHKERETVYSHDPARVAREWENRGAKFLHIVDLDGAFDGESPNTGVIKDIIDSISIPIQIGGGFRDMEKIELFMKEPRVARIILGTIAITEPTLLKEALKHYGNRIAVGIDARDGRVAIRGWVEKTELHSMEFGRQLFHMGVDTVIYTDISRDGMLKGPNIEATRAMIEETGLNIIASGGVSTLEDIDSVRQIGAKGIIIGQALYTGAVELEDALGFEGD